MVGLDVGLQGWLVGLDVGHFAVSLSLRSSTASAGQVEHSVERIFSTITNVFILITGGEITNCGGAERRGGGWRRGGDGEGGGEGEEGEGG